MKQALVVLGVLAGSMFTSCKKNNSKDTPTQNNLSVIENKVVGKWQLVSSIDSSTSPVMVTDVTRECEKDDVYTFTSNKTYSIDDGPNKCAASMVGGNWTVGADSLFKAEMVNCLCTAYPVLVFIDGTKMVLRNRHTSLSGYTVNTYRKL